MKRYTKIINNMPVTRSANKIVVIKDDRQFFNPSEEMILNDGWTEYKEPELTAEETLQLAKDKKVQDILRYDSSESINEFNIKGCPVWLDKATRTGLMLRFNAEQSIGKTETTLWYGTQQFPLVIEDAVNMLYAIEVYASMCYDVTQMHIANVSNLNTVEEVNTYNYETSYPDKLNFE